MKNISYITITFAMIIAFLFCGCRDAEQAELASSTTVPSTEGDSNSVAMLFYAKVLQDYEMLVSFRLSENFESSWNSDQVPALSAALASAIRDNPEAEWSNMVVGMPEGLENPTVSSFGYILKDMNRDDFPELFLVREDHAILAIFTCGNGQLVLLDAFWSKHEGILTDENSMMIRTSGGAAYTDYVVKILDPEGHMVQVKQFGTDGYSEDAETLYYEITDNGRNTIERNRFSALLLEYPFEFGSEWLSQTMISLG